MPTPSPMSAASVGAISETLMTCENRAMAVVAVPSATTAVSRGSAMPASEPKAMKMITAAAMMPMPSLLDSAHLRGLLDGLAADLHLHGPACRPPSRDR